MARAYCEVCGLTLLNTFRFPKATFDEWVKFARVSKKRLDSKKRTSFQLCTLHFREEDMRQGNHYTTLRCGTLPSLLPPPPDKNVEEYPDDVDEKDMLEDIGLFEDSPRIRIKFNF